MWLMTPDCFSDTVHEVVTLVRFQHKGLPIKQIKSEEHQGRVFQGLFKVQMLEAKKSVY